MSGKPKRSVMMSFRRGLVFAVGAGIIIYAIFAFWGGRDEVMDELARFAWILLAPILALSLGNYLIRFLRWQVYLRVLGLKVPLWTSLSVFMAGLAMTITPGKLGEFLKSYLLRETDGIPMTRTAPVVFMERVTDLLALVALASVGVGTYYEKGVWILGVSGAALLAGVAVLYSRTLCLLLLRPLHRIPRLDRIAAGVQDTVLSAHDLTRPVPLLAGLALGTAAWTCECLGFHLCFVALEQEMAAGASIFVYAFSTIAGVVSPGGLGATDASLVGFAMGISDGLTESAAVTAAFVCRACTLWFAIAVGAVFLMRFSTPLQADLATVRGENDADPADASSPPA
jgi:glycosyltransferase 2 family protein